MANRLVGNTWILDTASGNTLIPIHSGGMEVGAVTFWSLNSTGVCEISGANTTDVLVKLTNPNPDDATVGIVLNGIDFDEIKLPTLTAGTAWIYLR